MAIQLYAESGARGFKANQVEIPIAKVINSIQQHGKQNVKNIDTVAKAHKERSKIWLDGKLRADKVQLDNIRDNHIFFEKNKEWIRKWEQKELDDRAKSAQIDYRNQQRRPPDKSLLEKLGPALAKAVPTIVGAVQAHQEAQDLAAAEAGQEAMLKLKWSPAELAGYQTKFDSLRSDTAAQEAWLESMLGTVTDKTGHVFNMADFVKVLEDRTGAYAIAAGRTAVMNGAAQYEQELNKWHLENRYDYTEPEAFAEAFELKQLEIRNKVLGKDYFNTKLPTAIKYTEWAPQAEKIHNAIRARQHRYFEQVAKDVDNTRLVSNLAVAAGTDNEQGFESIIQSQVARYGGNRNVAFDKIFPALTNLAKNGQLDTKDTATLMRIFRRQTNNHSLGIEGNQNYASIKIEELNGIIQNHAAQTLNNDLRMKSMYEAQYNDRLYQELTEEPGAAGRWLEIFKNSNEGRTFSQSGHSAVIKTIKSFIPGSQADTRTYDKKVGFLGAGDLIKSKGKTYAQIAIKEGTKVSLKSIQQNGIIEGLETAKSRFELILKSKVNEVIANSDNSEWRNNPSAYMPEIIEKANELAQEEANRIGLFNAVQDPKDPTKWSITSLQTGKPVIESESTWRTRVRNNADSPDKVWLGRGTGDVAAMNVFAAKVNTMNPNELTTQDVLGEASNLWYITEGARMLGITPGEFFVMQLKTQHPSITIPETAYTTSKELEGIKGRMKDLSGGFYKPTNTSMQFQNGRAPTLAPGFMPTSHTPGMIPQDAPSGAWRNLGASGPYADILNFIQSVEAVGGYNVLNTVGATPGLDQMTIAEAHRVAMNSAGSGAMGAYQQMPGYLFDRAKSVGLDPNTAIFNKENQEKLAILLINGSGYNAWLDGQLPTSTFANRLAGQWRGLPAGSHNKTYQDQYAGANAAGETWDRFIQMLEAHKRMRSQAPGYPYMPSNPPFKSQRGRVI